MAARVLGNTPEEMEADAKALLGQLRGEQEQQQQQTAASQQQQRQQPDPTQGGGQGAMALNGDPIENAMRAAVGLQPISSTG